MKYPTQRGLTLIELSVTLSIVAVTATTAVGGFGELIQKRRTEGLAAELASDLQFVRTEAVMRNQGVRISFGSDATGARCYVIHTGPAEACDCLGGTPTGPAACAAGAAEIKTVRLPSGSRAQVQANVASMLYDPRGTVSPTATLQVRGADGRQLNQVVNLLGRVRTCAVGGAWAGYRAC
jgi:type IV fimbrial biogenesis protein FimT